MSLVSVAAKTYSIQLRSELISAFKEFMISTLASFSDHHSRGLPRRKLFAEPLSSFAPNNGGLDGCCPDGADCEEKTCPKGERFQVSCMSFVAGKAIVE